MLLLGKDEIKILALPVMVAKIFFSKLVCQKKLNNFNWVMAVLSTVFFIPTFVVFVFMTLMLTDDRLYSRVWHGST